MKLWENLVERVRVRLFALILPELVEFTAGYDSEIDSIVRNQSEFADSVDRLIDRLTNLSAALRKTEGRVDELSTALYRVEDQLDDVPCSDDIPDYDELIERAVYALQDYIPDADDLAEETISRAHDHIVDWIVEALQNYPRR